MADNFTSQSPLLDDDLLSRQVVRKVAWRLIPFLCVLYAFNILDRVNVGFARLTMQDDLKISKEIFDIGYGLFYIGYLLFEVPSNLLLRRFGARRWIARIMISWGIVSIATMAVNEVWGFYTIRVLLGIAEAGFFPGIILYLSCWFPARERARMMAYFMTAIAVANIVGNPISGAIMEFMHGVDGLKGWQWLFFLEGIPSVLLGIAVFWLLTDRPAEARWLSERERSWLVARMHREENERREQHGADRFVAMFHWRVWLLIALYFTVAVGANAFGAYAPTLIQAQYKEQGPFAIGLLSALPHLCAIVGMTFLGMSSDRTGDRRYHVAAAALLASVGWSITALAMQREVHLIGLCLAQTGMLSMLPIFWTLPTTFLTGIAAAGGIALINSVANIGGFFGPTILGQLGLWAMVSFLALGAALACCVRREATTMSSGENRA